LVVVGARDHDRQLSLRGPSVDVHHEGGQELGCISRRSVHDTHTHRVLLAAGSVIDCQLVDGIGGRIGVSLLVGVVRVDLFRGDLFRVDLFRGIGLVGGWGGLEGSRIGGSYVGAFRHSPMEAVYEASHKRSL
jgi:hypothetical protein